MPFNLESIILHIICVILTLFIGLYTYFSWSFRYWQRKQIPYAKPGFPFGNLKIVSKHPQPFSETLQINYEIFKAQGHKHLGMYFFSRPIYVPLDVEYVKNIISKDFDYFVDRNFYHDEDDPLSENVSNLQGERWRNLRARVTPAFTSSKLKAMLQTITECSLQLKEAMDIICTIKDPVNIYEVVAGYTMNVIGSVAFGIDCNCFKDTNSSFKKYGQRFFRLTPLETLERLLGFSAPKLAKMLGCKSTPIEVTNFFVKIVDDTVKYREANNVIRQDLMQVFIEIKNNSNGINKKGVGLTQRELAAQVFIFFAAGYETSATTMTFCIFELAQNLGIQVKARDEIVEILRKYKGEITYEALTEMKYMGHVIDETLRKHPPVAFLNRTCVKNYTIPDTDIQIDKGTSVLIPISGLHRDPDLFPNPESFDPDRFSQQNKSSVVPYSYLPFGDGPRNCIGSRIALTQIKIGLSVLLKNYRFTLNEKTKVPIKIDPHNFVYTAEGGIWVNAERI